MFSDCMSTVCVEVYVHDFTAGNLFNTSTKLLSLWLDIIRLFLLYIPRYNTKGYPSPVCVYMLSDAVVLVTNPLWIFRQRSFE